MSLEVICHTQEDARNLVRNGVIPDYVPEEIKECILIASQEYHPLEMFIRPRGMKKAIENKCFPVSYFAKKLFE